MKRKLMFFSTIILIALGFIVHYSFNIQEVTSPPSETWSKEVLVDTADIQVNPKIIKYKDSYIIAYNNGEAIKIVSVDNFGGKLQEKSFPIDKQVPYNITLLTDGNSIYLYWIQYDDGKNIEGLKLDDKFNVLENEKIKGIEDLNQIDEKVMMISYKDKIDIRNIYNKETAVINAADSKLLTGTKVNNDYIVAYTRDNGKYYYSYFRDGNASEPKYVGTIDEVTNVSFYNSAIAVDDKYGYIVVELRVKGEFGRAMLLKFSLTTGEFTLDELKLGSSKAFVSDLTPYFGNEGAEFLASSYVAHGKKESNLNIVQIKMNQGENVHVIPVSRIRGSAIYPAFTGDRVVFYKPIEKGKAELYLASSAVDFIDKHNVLTKPEIRQAILDTTEAVTFSIVYILLYGIIWFVPGVILNSLSLLFDFKTIKRAKIWFVLSYAATLILKCYLIYTIAFRKNIYFMPKFLTPPLGMAICIAISIFYFVFGYSYFKKDAENNMMIIDFSLALIMDTLITLVFFVPFFI